MKRDIENIEDIRLLIDGFYEKVKLDEIIFPFFKEMSEEKWAKHLDIMYSFWNNAIFLTGNYTGYPMETHRRISAVMPMQRQHFERWIQLFTMTADELFKGKNTEALKQTAISISALMQTKITKKHENPE